MLHFDDVRVPAEALVGEEGAGFRQVFHGLNPERITGAALGVGGHLTALRRTSSGTFTVARAAPVEDAAAVHGTGAAGPGGPLADHRLDPAALGLQLVQGPEVGLPSALRP